MPIEFTKMQATGNDFIIIDELERAIVANKAEFAKLACDRHFGIGADGVLFISKASSGVYGMKIINPDGSEAEMCGNGMRCVALYLKKYHAPTARKFRVKTLAGIIEPELEPNGLIRVKMGKPSFKCRDLPMECKNEMFINQEFKVGLPDESIVKSARLPCPSGMGELPTADFTRIFRMSLGSSENLIPMKMTAVSVGNPHAIFFVKNVVKVPLMRLGPVIGLDYRFPQGVNVHFAQVVSKNTVRLVTWERGAGLTLACGTGAVSTVSAGYKLGLLGTEVRAELPGGELSIKLEIGKKGEIANTYLIGPAVEVFKGKWETAQQFPSFGASAPKPEGTNRM